MTAKTLERQLSPLSLPVEGELLRWLYLHLPPQPIRTKKMHRSYSAAVRILMHERVSGRLSPADNEAVGKYLSAIVPFVEKYEMQRFPAGSITPEAMLRFFMEQHGLNQYDLAKDLGGQPVVSDVLRGKRRLSREHIERLGRRFGVAPATFYATRPQV
jgi:antitoxin component HigA of HigAB toxin-antitoxin module